MVTSRITTRPGGTGGKGTARGCRAACGKRKASAILEESPVTAGELMTPDVVVVHPEDSLGHAVTLLARRRFGGLVVADAAGTIVGVLTEGELMRWHQGRSEQRTREHQKVKAAMSSAVITASEDTPGREIANLMMSKGIKRVPVVRDGRSVGIAARSDLVRALAERLGARWHAAGEEAAAWSLDEALKHRREETVPQRRG